MILSCRSHPARAGGFEASRGKTRSLASSQRDPFPRCTRDRLPPLRQLAQGSLRDDRTKFRMT